MFEGNQDEGEMEIGQVSGIIDSIKPAGIILSEMIQEYETTRKKINETKF